MIYYLMNPSTRFILTLRVNLPRDNLKLPSMTQLWEAMSFHERETREMFGIDFEGHPNLIPLLLPPDWRGGYPLRKDFKGEGAQP
jgi:NADH-quinone oxidoreductase subunit C